VHIASGLHVAEYVILQLGNGLKKITDILVLLNIPDDFRCFGSFGEIDKASFLDDGRDSVFDEC
jgi:hypothetical protein